MISLLSCSGLMKMNDVSYRVYAIVAIGVAFFAIGASLNSPIEAKIQEHTRRYNFDKLRKYFIYIEIVAIVIMFFADIIVIALLRSGYSMEDIYYMRLQLAQGGDNALSNTSNGATILLEYIARPVLAIAVPLTVIDYLVNKSKKTVLYTLLLLVLGYINKANRLDILMSIFIFLYAFVVFTKRDKNKTKKYLSYGFGAIACFFLFNYLTTMRGGKADLGDTFYYYACGNMPFFDIKLRSLDMHHEYTYGLTSFQGVVRPFGQALTTLGFELPDIYETASKYADVEEMVDIGSDGSFNAFIGPFYFFYCDMGLWGVILFSLITGYVIEKLYRKSIYSKDPFVSVVFLVFFIRGCVFSFFNYPLVGITYGMTVWILYYLSKKIKI